MNFKTHAPARREGTTLQPNIHNGTKKVREMIMEWFSQRRLSELLQKEEKRKALLDATKSGAVAAEATVVRIADACAGKDVAVRTMAGHYRRSHDLQRDIGTVSTSGSKDDVLCRHATCAVNHCRLRARRGGRVAGGFGGGLARVRNVRHGRRSD